MHDVAGGSSLNHADLAEDAKLQQYAKEFPGLSRESSPSLEIISMEHHGSEQEYARVLGCPCDCSAHTADGQHGVPYTFVSYFSLGSPDTGYRTLVYQL